jgi:hypothetical protein
MGAEDGAVLLVVEALVSIELGTEPEVVVAGILEFVNLLKLWLNCPNALEAHAARRNEDKRMFNEWLPNNGLR